MLLHNPVNKPSEIKFIHHYLWHYTVPTVTNTKHVPPALLVLVSVLATVCLVVAGGLLVFLASQDIGCFKPLLTSELRTSKLEVLFLFIYFYNP